MERSSARWSEATKMRAALEQLKVKLKNDGMSAPRAQKWKIEIFKS